jgi:chromosome segregation protein
LNLLGRIIVVENLDKAVRLAKKYRHQYKLVTLEGDILNPGGSMTGGSAQKKALHVFGRSREIRNLRQALQAALNPTKSSNYYFVADVNGKTYFAKTLAEHNKNIEYVKTVKPNTPSDTPSGPVVGD